MHCGLIELGLAVQLLGLVDEDFDVAIHELMGDGLAHDGLLAATGANSAMMLALTATSLWSRVWR